MDKQRRGTRDDLAALPFLVVLGPEQPLVRVGSLADASRAVRDYIDTRSLGAREWYAFRAEGHRPGEVLKAGELVARVSYNGRVWAPDEETEIPVRPQPRRRRMPAAGRGRAIIGDTCTCDDCQRSHGPRGGPHS